MKEMNHNPSLTCREIIDFVADYIFSELDRETRKRFEHHMDACTSCREYLETYRQTMTLERCLKLGDKTEPFPPELVQAILAARR